jgi:hypothetical protein
MLPEPIQHSEIVDYVYEHTTCYEPGATCAMRDLIIRFTACHIYMLRGKGCFEDLVERHPQIGLDLFRVMTE